MKTGHWELDTADDWTPYRPGFLGRIAVVAAVILPFAALGLLLIL